MMTDLEIFNTVRSHLIKQNCRSIDAFLGTCKYRGTHNMSCAVGCLLSDDVYATDLEGMSVKCMRQFRATAQSYSKLANALEASIGRELNDSTIDLLIDLQDMHDHVACDRWEVSLTNVGRKYGFID